MRTTLALICILAVAAVSSAVPIIVGVALNVVDNGVPVHDGTPVPGYTQYLIYLVGDPAVGLNGAQSGGLGCLLSQQELDDQGWTADQIGFVGTMSQNWMPSFSAPYDPTPTRDMANGLDGLKGTFLVYGTAMDSHLTLRNVASSTYEGPDAGLIAPGYVPVEDNSAGGPGHGLGTGITGFDVGWLNAVPNLLVAQIVVPDGQQVLFKGRGSFKYEIAGRTEPVYGDNLVTAVIGIPEPATLGLLAIGGIVALIRRRR